MSDRMIEDELLNFADQSLQNALRFSHQAMGSLFEIYIYNDDASYAEQAAGDAFLLVNRIEQSLSHFIENSDISKIGSLQEGESTRVGIDTMESLLHCSFLYQITEGLFDITIGPLYECWLNEDKTLKDPTQAQIDDAKNHVGMNFLRLDPANMMVSVQKDSLRLDLGGYGKGYAVDRVAELLEEWEIENALIHAGYSSLFAFGNPDGVPGWPVSLTHPVTKEELGVVFLSEAGMSASGIRKGRHIINPKTGRPNDGHLAVWTLGEDAATADGLSTALMMMDVDWIQQLCEKHNENSALIISGQQPDYKIFSINFPLSQIFQK